MIGKDARRLVGVLTVLGGLAIPASAGAAVLYDQNSGADPAGTGVFSINDPDTTLNDTEVADDFTVPADQTWTIGGIQVTGHYDFGGGPVAGVNVRIYANSATLPAAAPMFEQLNITPVEGNAGTPSFSIPVTGAPALAGAPVTGTKYWISVQANIDYPDNIWDWDNRSLAAGTSPAAFRSGGVIAACTAPTWTPRSSPTCGLAGQTFPDQMFRLCDTPCTTVQPPPPPAGGGGTATPTPTPTVTAPKCKKGQKLKKGKCVKKKRKKKK